MILRVARARLAAALAATGAWCAVVLVVDAVLAAAGVAPAATPVRLVGGVADALGGTQDAAPDSLEALLARGLAALAYLLVGRLAALVVGPRRRPSVPGPRRGQR